MDGERVEVHLTGSGDVPDLAILEDELSERFGAPVTLLVEYSPTVIFEYSDTDGLSEIG